MALNLYVVEKTTTYAVTYYVRADNERDAVLRVSAGHPSAGMKVTEGPVTVTRYVPASDDG